MEKKNSHMKYFCIHTLENSIKFPCLLIVNKTSRIRGSCKTAVACENITWVYWKIDLRMYFTNTSGYPKITLLKRRVVYLYSV